MVHYHNDPHRKSSLRNLDKRLWKELRSYLSESGFDVKTWGKNDFLNNHSVLISLGNEIFTLSIRGTSVSDLEFKGSGNTVIVSDAESVDVFIVHISKYIDRLREKHDERVKGISEE